MLSWLLLSQEEVILSQNPTRKKHGVSGEASTMATARISLKHFDKDFRLDSYSIVNYPEVD